MTTKAERLENVCQQLRTVVRRFEETYEKDPAVYGNSTDGHTDLTDGFAWAVGALHDAAYLTKYPERMEAMIREAQEANAMLASVYGEENQR